MRAHVLKYMLYVAILSLAMLPEGSFAHERHMLTFKEWRTVKVLVYKAQSDHVQKQIYAVSGSSQNAAAKRAELKVLYAKLKQTNWNSDVASHLSVRDYVALYVSVQPETDRFQRAAKGLNSTEVAELIQAYSDSLHEAPSRFTTGASDPLNRQIRAGGVFPSY